MGVTRHVQGERKGMGGCEGRTEVGLLWVISQDNTLEPYLLWLAGS